MGSFFEHELSDVFTFRNNMRYTHVDTLYRVTVNAGDTIADCTGSVYAGCIDGQTIPRRAVQGDGDSDGFAVDNQLQASFATGSVKHVVLGGVDYFHTKWEHFRDIVGLAGLPRFQVDPILDIFDPEPRGIAGYIESLSPQIYGSAKSEQTGVYLQDQIAFGGLRVSVGGRYDWAKDVTNNLLTDTSENYDVEEFTWRAGAVYLFDNGIAPYFSYAESFLPQLVSGESTLGGVPFKPTTGRQYEAGLRYQGGRNIYVTVGAFEITQQNVQTSHPTEICPSGRSCLIQAGEAQVRGLEFEGRASLASGTTLIASFTHLDAKVTKDVEEDLVGKNLTEVPNYLASLFLDQSISGGALEGLGFGGGVRYTGKSWGDSTNTNFRMDDYTLFDVFLRYDLGAVTPGLENMTLSLNARNITNKHYLVTCSSYQSCFYGQGRVVTARLQFKW